MNLSIIFGGMSYEHEISIISAITIFKKINNLTIKHFIFLDSMHEFYLIDHKNMISTYFSSLDYKKSKKLVIGSNDFYEMGFFGNKKPISCGVVINLIHGADGEDGILSSLFDFYNINYIGPRLEGSILSYNKHLTKLYAKERDINVLPFEICKKGTECKIQIKLPFIIKPLRLGSSIGVSVITEEKKIEYACDVAFEYDNELLIEPFISGVKEYNLAGIKLNNNEYAFSIVEEPNKKDMLCFEDKYLDFSRTESVNNADISPEVRLSLECEFKKIYENKFEGALIRCDFFIIDNVIYLNEINPVPGSMANYLFQDFENILKKAYLPKKRNIKVNYEYIHKIHAMK